MFPPIRLTEAFHLGGLTPRQVVVRTWTKINDNEILTRASAVSFYAMAALVPILALLLTALIYLLPDLSEPTGRSNGVGNLTVDQFKGMLKDVFPKEAYAVVEDQIKRIQQEPPLGLLSMGLVIALWTASSLYLAIMDAMNRVYGVVETRSFLRLRITALLMTIIQAGILLGALIAIVAGPEILRIFGYTGNSAIIALGIQWSVITVMVLVSFALTFYVGPDAETSWEWMTPGSLLGTAVFFGFTLLFRVYIQKYAHYDRTYGSLGGVMVLLLWFWVSSVVLLTAGQMNKVIEEASPLGKNHGQKFEPDLPPDLSELPAKPMT